MGRKKIVVQPIQDERTRHVTFNKRKAGLVKKAMELAILCDCQISLIIFNSDNQLFEFCSEDPRTILQRYCTVAHMPHERLTKQDYTKFEEKTTVAKRRRTDGSGDSEDDVPDFLADPTGETGGHPSDGSQQPQQSSMFGPYSAPSFQNLVSFATQKAPFMQMQSLPNMLASAIQRHQMSFSSASAQQPSSQVSTSTPNLPSQPLSASSTSLTSTPTAQPPPMNQLLQAALASSAQAFAAARQQQQQQQPQFTSPTPPLFPPFLGNTTTSTPASAPTNAPPSLSMPIPNFPGSGTSSRPNISVSESSTPIQFTPSVFEAPEFADIITPTTAAALSASFSLTPSSSAPIPLSNSAPQSGVETNQNQSGGSDGVPNLVISSGDRTMRPLKIEGGNLAPSVIGQKHSLDTSAPSLSLESRDGTSASFSGTSSAGEPAPKRPKLPAILLRDGASQDPPPSLFPGATPDLAFPSIGFSPLTTMPSQSPSLTTPTNLNSGNETNK